MPEGDRHARYAPGRFLTVVPVCFSIGILLFGGLMAVDMPTDNADRSTGNTHPLAGKFIVFDGVDGCGKSTQLTEFENDLNAYGVKFKRFREPGGTLIGEDIRNILLTKRGEGMNIRAEMLLYMASRAQLVYQEIRPALAAGFTVLADRYTSSTLAYQGAGGGIADDEIMAVAAAATGNLWPDLTIILDLPITDARRRTTKKGDIHQAGLFEDRIEQRAAQFHQRVRDGFIHQCSQFPDRYRLVSAVGSQQTVHKRIITAIEKFFAVRKAR